MIADAQVEEATAKTGLAGLIRRTPLVAIAAVQQRIGPVLLKLENLQSTRSFKIRGAVRKLASLSDDERSRGIVAASAGNHGAGVALAASRLGIGCTVVVPANAPAVKIKYIESLGVQVIIDGANYDQAELVARIRASNSGALFVSPFDDDLIIAGNGGDLARELLEQAPDLSRVVCSVGGGGLIGGMAQELAPRGIELFGVQPEANCAMYESLKLGRALTQYKGGDTLAEGCEGAIAERTYELARKHVKEIVLVTEAEIRSAVAFCFRVAGVIAECSAAVAMAGFLGNAVRAAQNGTTVCIITGGNIEPDLLDEILANEPA